MQQTITEQILSLKHYFKQAFTEFAQIGDEYLAKIKEKGGDDTVSFFVEIIAQKTESVLLQSGKFNTVKEALEWVNALDYVSQGECDVLLTYYIEDGSTHLLGVVDFPKVFQAEHIV